MLRFTSQLSAPKTSRWLVGTLCLSSLLLIASCDRGSHTIAPASNPIHSDQPGLFSDAAIKAGVRFQHTNGASGRFYMVETTGSGCAFIDYDNDGFLDIVLIQAGPVLRTRSNDPSRWCRLYHNQGDGTFRDVTAGSGLDRDLGCCQGVAIGDYDNDGYDDIFITGYGGNHLLHNAHGSGRFEDVTGQAHLTDTEDGPRYATSAAFGDYDNDGKLDLYVCHYTRWSPQMEKGCASAGGVSDYCLPDLYPPDQHRLYHNNGDGTFSDVTASSGIGSATGRGQGVVWLDYDGDGREDIYVANDLGPAFLWHNDGHGKFSNRALQANVASDNNGANMAGMGIGVGDYNNSGRESLFVTNFSGQPDTLFRNDGGGLFTDVSLESGVAGPHIKLLSFGADFIDYDADGWKDIITANGHVELHANTTYVGTTYKEPKQLLHNEHNGRFSEVTENLGDLTVPTVSRGLAVGDYDNDGRLDFLVNNQNGAAQLFHNEIRNSNHWISLKTIGTRSNRDGYGARLSLVAGGLRESSEVHSSSSFASHSDSRVYFGLGDSAKVDRLEIHWPSGTSETIRGIPAGKIYVLTEGKGITGSQPSFKPPRP